MRQILELDLGRDEAQQVLEGDDPDEPTVLGHHQAR